MSTKTTFKRVALVAVASLGFGLVGPVSANAAGPSTMTVPITNMTLVDTTNAFGFIPVNIFDVAGIASALDTGESITATVIEAPKGVDSTTATSDITFTAAKRTHTNGASTYAAANASTFTSDSGTAGSFSFQAGGSANGITSIASNKSGTYTFAIQRASGKALDKGTYVIRIRLQDTTGFVTQQNVSVNFVSSAADTGAVITLASSGSFVAGETVTMSATQSLTATLKNAAGGRIFNTGLITAGPGAPALTAGLWGDTTPALKGATSDWYVTDTGTQSAAAVNAYDFYSATASDSATVYSSDRNGVYGIGHVANSSTSGLGVTQLTVSPYIRVTYGATAATLAITVRNAAGGTASTPLFIAVGALATTCGATACNLPLTTKTASFRVTGATAGNAYSYSVKWTKVAAGDQTPLDATATTVYADASGAILVPVTVANPIDGASAVVTITGFPTNPAAQTINWLKSKAANISVDVNGAYVPLKNATVFTATITDNFGAPVSGVLLQPALSSTSANYSATPLATVLTDAAGKVTVTITDALAVAAGTDTLTFTAVDGTTLAGSSNPAKITYAATAPVVTALTAFYSPTAGTVTGESIVTPVPATGVYVDGVSSKFPIKTDRNTSVGNAKATGVDQLIVRINTGAIGARVSATASAGAYILNSSNLQATSRTFYSGINGYAGDWVLGSNKTGANTVTFTSGTVSTTVAFWVGNTANDARFVTLAQAGAGSPVIAQVTDRYGNGVANASVQISTSAGTLGNGQITTAYTTDLDGKISVMPVGAATAVITAIATSSTAQHSDPAGYVGATAVNATLAAGNNTATLTVTPSESAVDVAQAATDAAAEATDAANAATDAANAAAEAADAATAAAQDAADAVAALSTQVGEMIDALKKQITALTNLVIKIQKKVKA